MKITFTTNNKHKSKEIKNILGKDFEIVSLAEIGCHEDISETRAMLEENVRQEPSYVVKYYDQNCFADDTGLEVEALGGEPGVHSARYAKGTDHDSEANIRKLLVNLEGKANRRAYSRTIISLITDGVEYQSEDKVEGKIATESHGTEGSGYNPTFTPEGYGKSFAELGEETKDRISHRARAVKKLVEYLGKPKGQESKKVKEAF